MSTPTSTTYDELQKAYDYFNKEIFGGQLCDCLITLQRKNRTYGYFSPNKFVSQKKESTDEIALNPSYFAICPPEEVMQTLVHEMTHLWQFHHGTPGRRGYHNAEWANKMESIGLMPSSTGKEGGKRTGESMADYIIKGGIFEKKLGKLMKGKAYITWADRIPPREKLKQIIQSGEKNTILETLNSMGVKAEIREDEIFIESLQKNHTRLKYTCPKCASNIWGKPNLNILCVDCNVTFEPE